MEHKGFECDNPSCSHRAGAEAYGMNGQPGTWLALSHFVEDDAGTRQIVLHFHEFECLAKWVAVRVVVA